MQASNNLADHLSSNPLFSINSPPPPSVQDMHHLLLVDEMVGFVDQTHELTEVGSPVVEDVAGVLVLHELNDACQAVHLGGHGTIDNKAGQKLLSLL